MIIERRYSSCVPIAAGQGVKHSATKLLFVISKEMPNLNTQNFLHPQARTAQKRTAPYFYVEAVE